ncbi:restriction endonuclease subunit S [Limnospira platensis]|uniref:restriction endonuclease subunit S n=1 Tax=Limnospira platensis TaxID=118562 RepID=UPI0002803E06|nr:restriction modification system DNA specificity domain protein [Arthrospira platensis C1]UWU46003.1 type I restriction enzyme, S subunit [Arthrospira platensis C1]
MKGWKQKTIEKCFKVKSGDFLPKNKMLSIGNIDVYGGNGVVGKHDKYNLTGENIIIGRVGAKCGNINRVKGNIWITDNAFYISEFTEEFDLKFLEYLLKTRNLRKTANQAAQPVISYQTIKDIILVIPPLPEQKRIVAILDEAFEGIDRAIANTQKNLANARELFESYLNGIFTRKGEGWVEKKLGDVCDFLNGFAFKSAETVKESDVQLVRMGNLYQNKLDLERSPVFYPNEFQNIYKKYVLSEGDLVMSLTGTVDKQDYGYTVEVPQTEKILLLNQRIVKFINIDPNMLIKKFFLYLLRSKPFLDNLYKTSRGVRQANLSSSSMKKIKINLPPVEKQDSLIWEFCLLSAETQRLETIYQRKLEALQELKQSILQKAFTGELTNEKAKEEVAQKFKDMAA